VPYASKVVTQLRGARVAIQEAFGIIITTQSDEPPAGFFREELEFARGVRDGAIDKPGYLPLLYEFPRAIQTDRSGPWRDTALWPQVLPSLGRPVSLEILKSDYAAAAQRGEKAEREWLSQHLNIEIGVAIQFGAWEGAAQWQAAEAGPLALEAFLDLVECVTVGGDGGGLDDLLGLTLIGRAKDGSGWLSWSRAWCWRGALAARKEISGKLEELDRAGEMMIVDRLGDDVLDFADIVEEVWRRGLLPEKAGIGLDPVGVAAIVDELHARKIPTDIIVGVPQGYRLSGAIKGAARKLADGTLKPAAQELMRWCVGNAKTEMRGNAVLVTKQVSGASKIDPLCALFNAFDLMARNPEAANGPSIYETEEPMIIGEGDAAGETSLAEADLV
jgi:phage terminase large subunit-like protein